PAVLASRVQPGDALKQGGRSTATRAQHRLRHTLVAAEIAVALVLLAGAGFFVRGLQRFTARDFGWNPDGLLAGYVALPGKKYPDAERRRALIGQFHDRLAALPGVEHAAVGTALPIWFFGSSRTLV